MAFKAAGNPISVFREQQTVNTASFTGTGTNPTANSDFFQEMARIDGTPARQTRTHDSTDYASSTRVYDSWEQQLCGGSGANAIRLSDSTVIRGGSQT